MTPVPADVTARSIRRTYLLLTLLTTLAASFIWGINTLFLLDAGLTNTEAFAANAFFTSGQVLFEVPTGVVADTRGRRFSFLLGAATLLVSTLLYLLMWQLHAPVLGVGGRVGRCSASGSRSSPARPRRGWWTRCRATGFEGSLEAVFGRAQIGRRRRDARRLGGRRLHRAGHQPRRAVHPPGGDARRDAVVALGSMHDIGFTPRRGATPVTAVRTVLSRRSIDGGLPQPAGALADARRRRSPPASASTPSTRCSRTCSSCTATRRRTASPAWRRRSSPARRSSAGCSCRGCGASSDAGPMRCSSAASLDVVLLAAIGLDAQLRGRDRRWSRLVPDLRARSRRCARRSSTASSPPSSARPCCPSTP